MKIFEGEMLIRAMPTTLFQIHVCGKVILNYQVIVKIVWIHKVKSGGTISINPSNAEATFFQSTKIFENHLNSVMLVFIG